MNAPQFTDSPEQAKVVNAPTGDDVLVVAGAGATVRISGWVNCS